MARHCSVGQSFQREISHFSVFSLLRLVKSQVFKLDCWLSLEHQCRSVLTSVGLGGLWQGSSLPERWHWLFCFSSLSLLCLWNRRFLVPGKAAPLVWLFQSTAAAAFSL